MEFNGSYHVGYCEVCKWNGNRILLLPFFFLKKVEWIWYIFLFKFFLGDWDLRMFKRRIIRGSLLLAITLAILQLQILRRYVYLFLYITFQLYRFCERRKIQLPCEIIPPRSGWKSWCIFKFNCLAVNFIKITILPLCLLLTRDWWTKYAFMTAARN